MFDLEKLDFYVDGIKRFDSGTRGYSQLFSFRETTWHCFNPIISYMRKKVANDFIRRFLTFLFFLALKDVSKQLWSTLYDFPELQNCVKLKEYMDECVRLSWMLAVQIPPMSIEYEATEFSEKLHGRFMTSDMTSLGIKYHVWPALIDSKAGVVLYRGTVVT